MLNLPSVREFCRTLWTQPTVYFLDAGLGGTTLLYQIPDREREYLVFTATEAFYVAEHLPGGQVELIMREEFDLPRLIAVSARAALEGYAPVGHFPEDTWPSTS